MSAEESIEAAADQHKSKNLTRSQYKDVMVKVDEDIYYLDRLQLALKSGYFEKLFTQDYSDKNSDLIELPLIDTDTFSAVVDVIYGEELKSVINADNFVSLLMAMDYLQMDIDPETYKSLANGQLRWSQLLNKDIFKLYYFIADDVDYECLLPIVFEHLSGHLEKLQDRDEILSIKIDHFVKIISNRESKLYGLVFEKSIPSRTISKLCTRWICHDMENRLRHALDLVNAARFRFHLSNEISHQDFNLESFSIKEHLNQNSISTYFHKWMMYCGVIRRPEAVFSETVEATCACNDCKEYRNLCSTYDFEKNRRILSSRKLKLESVLKNGYFYDITVQVGGKVYKLHRSVLKSESVYFEEIFTKEFSELAAKCKRIPPPPPSKDKIYSLDEIDAATFDMIVNHMYLVKVEPTSDIIVRLLKAVHTLRIDNLKNTCCEWITSNSEVIDTKDVIEILNFTHLHADYKDLNRLFISKYIVDSWPKIDNLPQFVDLFKAIALPDGTNSTDENKAYLFNKVDQETFKLIIDFIYFDKTDFKDDSLVGVLKASYTFKIEKLIEVCINKLVSSCDSMSSSDVKEVLILSLENFQYHEVLNTVYLVKYMMQWPEVDLELFCTISYECLENMLLSNDLYFDDPRDLLDICSKWVEHDVENRYRLVPRIAFAISRNCIANLDDYCMKNPSNWKQCTQDFVKNKIWEILSSTSVLPFALLSDQDETKRRKTDLPVFVTSHKGRAFRIYNADGDEIVSFGLCENTPEMDDHDMCYVVRYPMAATIVNDNLFILCSMHEMTFFYFYSLSSETLCSLATDRRLLKRKDGKSYGRKLKYTLLNCRNEIYCCFEDGEVLKYSFEFNRWKCFSAAVPDKPRISFASDGGKLYRMYETSRTDTTTTCSVQVYDLSQNQWISVLNMPDLTRHHESYNNSEKDRVIHELVSLNNYGLAALFHRCLFIFDEETRTWKNIRSMPYDYVNCVVEEHSIVSQNEAGEMLYVTINKLYQFSATNQTWTLKKEWPLLKSKSLVALGKILPYGNIIGIHNPEICGT